MHVPVHDPRPLGPPHKPARYAPKTPPTDRVLILRRVGSIAASDAGLAAAAAVLYALGQRYGSSVLVWTYMLPLMWVNHWIGEPALLFVRHAPRGS